jgi:hypothetical protein
MTMKDGLIIGALVISVPAIYYLRRLYTDIFDSPPKDVAEAAARKAADKAADKDAVMDAMSHKD